MIARVMRVKDLSNILREEIESSNLPPDSPILSARKLGEKYGTSTLTAHRAINILVKENLLYRIRGSGSFVSPRNGNGKALKVGISFPMPEGDKASLDAAFSIYPNTLTDSLKSEGHEIVNLTYYDLLNPEYIKEHITKLDGLILSKSCIDNHTFSLLEKTGLNIVILQHDFPEHFSCHQVIPDLRTGFKKAMEHIISQGFSTIHIASCNPEDHHKPRIKLIYMIAKELGLSRENIKLISSKRQIGDLGRMSGQEMGRQLIKHHKPPFAVFSLSDFTSFGIMDMILEHKLKPGKDVVLVSFDNLEENGLTPFGKPVISSVTNPKKKITAEAVKLLVSEIENNHGVTHIIRIPTEFIPRQSSRSDGSGKSIQVSQKSPESKILSSEKSATSTNSVSVLRNPRKIKRLMTKQVISRDSSNSKYVVISGSDETDN